MKIIKMFQNSNFVGTNLSRFKMGMGYYSVLMSTVTAVGVLKTAFPSISIWWMVALVPFVIIGTVFLGYLLDKWNVNTMDIQKTNEMSNRFLLTSDVKNQEFQMIQTQMIIEALNKSKKGEIMNIEELFRAYEEYKEKWKTTESRITFKKEK